MAAPTYYRITEPDGFVWYSPEDPREKEVDLEAVLKAAGITAPSNSEQVKLRDMLQDMARKSESKIEELSLEEALRAASSYTSHHRSQWEATQEARKQAAVALLQAGVEASVVEDASGASKNHLLAWCGYKKDKDTGKESYDEDLVTRSIIESIKALPTAEEKAKKAREAKKDAKGKASK